MPARLSRVPEVLDTLIALLKAHPDIEEVAVLDGVRKVNDFRPYLIIVGFRPQSDADIDSDRTAPRGLVSNDTATFDEPRQSAAGIPYVLVNGIPVIDDGQHTGALAGHSIRNPGG